MTASGLGAPGRESETDEAPRRGVGRQILLILGIGLLFRLILAYAIPGLRGSGFGADLTLFNYWADVLAQHQPWGFYANASYADYTPGYLYVLWPVGIARAIATAMSLPAGLTDNLIKLPAILTDVAMAYLAWSMAQELGVSRRRALVAAGVVVFNPLTWFDSVIWGQVDSFGTVFLMLGVRELWRGRHERASVLAVVAALIKPQLAILVPIVAVVTIRRALWPKGGFGDEPAPRQALAAAGERVASGLRGLVARLTTGPMRIITVGVIGYLTAVLLSLPFGLTVIGWGPTGPESSLLKLVFSTAATYPYLTVNAYNWWALVEVGGKSVMNGQAFWVADSPVPDATEWGQFGPVPAALVGAVLLLAVFAVVAWVVARRPDRLTILVGVSVLALAFFAVPTRVHERYLFPFFGLAGILFAVSNRWKAAYVVASIATFLNMYVVLVALYPDNPHVSDWIGIGSLVRSPFGVFAVALMHTLAFVFGFVQLRGAARRRLAAELEAAAVDAEGLDAAGRPVGADGVGATGERRHGAAGPGGVGPAQVGAAAAASGVAGGPGPARRLVPAWYDRPSWSEMGPWAWLKARVAETPLRPDRSASLARERGGRLDRLDLLLVLVILVASLVLRGYRVADPPRMHFDEVYHARTATEFLQFWRYGISHDIYEWTHPHFAKYAMAAGIVAFAGHDVQRSSDLGVPVRDAVVEPRREDLAGGTGPAGDRLWVATGTELIAYDLEGRQVLSRWALAGASSLAFDDTGDRVVIGTDGGDVLLLDTLPLDGASAADLANPATLPTPVATLGTGVARLVPYSDGTHVAALLKDATVAVVDADTAETVATVPVAGAADLVRTEDVAALRAVPASVVDAEAAARKLVEILGGDQAAYVAALTSQDAESVPLGVAPTTDEHEQLKKAMDDGQLPGVEFQPASVVAVAGSDGITFLDAGGAIAATVDISGGAKGLAQVTGVDDGAQLYATSTADDGKPQVTIVDVSGSHADNGPKIANDAGEVPHFQLPGAGTRVVYDEASELVEVLGATPDGSGTTVYVVEPHGKSVFADHRLPFAPTALALDHNKDFPSSSHGDLFAFSAEGTAASMDVGSYHFSWRMPGVIFGALTAAVLFLLARVLFRRRAVGVLVGAFTLVDGMFFVQSRIAMNDVYVGFFILAAYLVFALLWLHPERLRRWFWVLAPVMGVLLGLALASKWVAAYAIGALGILWLLRSALGRIVLILGMIAVTGLLGWMALQVPEGSDGAGNLPFVLIMIGLTVATVVITVYRPVSWTDDEIRFAVGAPPAVGMLVALAAIALGKAEHAYTIASLRVTPIQVAFALVVTGLVAYGAFVLAARVGLGPMVVRSEEELAAGPPPASPAPEGWVRLGYGLGIPAAWLALSLLVIPIGVYIVSYLPWAQVDGHQIIAGFPTGHTGQTLADLTKSMYDYHNGLTAAHAASSPWWAWPLDLKPVWFYQGGYAGDTSASIYDAGNLVVWWLGVPAMAFVAWQAYKRRSLALALVLVGFLAQWVSWARIDRAAFQYHYYTSLPFIVLALGYFVAEVWHGPSRRTWLLARASAAVALMGPVLLWLVRMPLCALAGTAKVNKDSAACVVSTAGNLAVTPAAGATVLVFLVTAGVLVWMLAGLGRPKEDGSSLTGRDLVPLVVAAAVGGAALAATRILPDADPMVSMAGIVPELIALVLLVPAGLLAIQVLVARDARRFALGIVGAAAAWFVVLYPNISALPLPTNLVNAYQGLLPTYLYAFQFQVDTIPRPQTVFGGWGFVALMAGLVIVSAFVAYASWVWRQALGAGAAEGSADGAADGPGPAGGPAAGAGPAGEPGPA